MNCKVITKVFNWENVIKLALFLPNLQVAIKIGFYIFNIKSKCTSQFDILKIFNINNRGK